MRTRTISGLVLLILTVFAFMPQEAQAQSWNVENVKMELQNGPLADLESCIKWIDKAAEHNKTKNSAKMYRYRGEVYLQVATGEAELAAKHPNALDIAYESFNKAMELDDSRKQKHAAAAKEMMLNVSVAYYNAGYMAYEAKDYDKSILSFNRCKELLAYDVEGRLKRETNLTEEAVLQMLGYCGMAKEDNAMAISSFNTLVERGVAEPGTYVTLAQLHLKGEDTTAALDILAAGKEMYETETDIINMELDIYLKQGRSEELIEKLNSAIEQDEENVIYYFARAISYEGMGEFDKALLDYDMIIELDEWYFNAYFNKGVLYRNRVSDLVREQQSKGIYDPKELAKYAERRDEYNRKAVENFAFVLENNDEMPEAERIELATEMRNIYASLKDMDKVAEMEAIISGN